MYFLEEEKLKIDDSGKRVYRNLNHDYLPVKFRELKEWSGVDGKIFFLSRLDNSLVSFGVGDLNMASFLSTNSSSLPSFTNLFIFNLNEAIRNRIMIMWTTQLRRKTVDLDECSSFTA